MAKPKPKPKKKRDKALELQGFKYLKQLLPLFEQLHDVGCQRDRAKNRSLFYDQYCLIVLLYLLSVQPHPVEGKGASLIFSDNEVNLDVSDRSLAGLVFGVTL